MYYRWVALTARQAVELFHLVFLRALVAKGEDKRLFALKGGCNLRFYFDSVRYSEDIDFDVTVIAKATLENKVGRLLRSPAVVAPLRAKGLDIVDVSAPKQTDTTQRWKAGLRGAGLPPLRTKIEFSRRPRGDIGGTEFEAVRSEVVRPYALPPFLATHYGTPAAIAQKIAALAQRGETQARDVFDLDLLLSRPDARILPAEGEPFRARALERAMDVSFGDYKAGVVAYLDPDQADIYGDPDAWRAMQARVVERLGKPAETEA
jgi:predicted nucleotidyltransferase component of viral defense system